MKKIVCALILVFALGVMLQGCGSNNAAPVDPKDSEAAETETAAV